MANLLSRIFGTDKALESAVDGVTKGLDALVYTDEEKAQAASQDRAEARALLVQWLEATSGQHLARRLIAVSITTVWLLQYIFSWLALTIAVFAEGPMQDQLNKASELTTQHANGMTGAVMLILSFYFAAPHMDKIVGVALDRFGNRNQANGQ